VTAHASIPDQTPYGLAIVFNMACAGHLELLPFDPSNDNPQQVPIGCFDATGAQLGPDDYVLGFTRVYAYDPSTLPPNSNPTIDSIDVAGGTMSVTPATGSAYVTPGFSSTPCDPNSSQACQDVPVGPVVPPSASESYSLPDNGTTHEEIWASFYTNIGSFSDEARLLYDATTGTIGDPSVTDAKWTPPTQPGDGFIWIVVHDNRGGASWATIPVHVQ
jgi:hypothetical protein